MKGGDSGWVVERGRVSAVSVGEGGGRWGKAGAVCVWFGGLSLAGTTSDALTAERQAVLEREPAGEMCHHHRAMERCELVNTTGAMSGRQHGGLREGSLVL